MIQNLYSTIMPSGGYKGAEAATEAMWVCCPRFASHW